MLDKAILITARQDIPAGSANRELMLLFMNAARRTVLSENTIRKFFEYKTVTHTDGVIDGTNIKFIRTVEYIDEYNVKVKLERLKSLDEAGYLGYDDITEPGTPVYYLEIGSDIYLIKVPTSGTIKVYGEFWPVDLTDSTSSSDVTTTELPEAWIYLAAAEYLDYFDEAEKGRYWREKGQVIVAQYLKQDNKQRLYNVGLSSDPLGNGGLFTKRKSNSSASGIDFGGW